MRTCTGEGCAQAAEGGSGGSGSGGGGGALLRGSNYCYKCFVLYHPRSDPQWRGHWADAREAGAGGGGSAPLAVVPAPEDPAALLEEHVEAMRAAMPLGGAGAGAGAGGGGGAGASQPAAGAGGAGGAAFSIPLLNVS